MKQRDSKTADEMDPEIRKFIERHRNDIDRLYDLPPAQRNMADEMLACLEKLGRKCRDKQEFDEHLYNRTMSHALYRMILDFSSYSR